jgi:hypothetical protein
MLDRTAWIDSLMAAIDLNSREVCCGIFDRDVCHVHYLQSVRVAAISAAALSFTAAEARRAQPEQRVPVGQ